MRFKKHGMHKTKTYRAWSAMKMRCLNPRNPNYKRYGARGISVCERWMTFENFFEDMGECPNGLSLDRIDNDGNYEPGNCRWATSEQQVNNRRCNNLITAFGETKTVSQWAKSLGINRGMLSSRINSYGMTHEDALSTPLQYAPGSKMSFDKARELRQMKAAGLKYRELAAHFGIGISTVHYIVVGKFWPESANEASK